VRREVWEQVGLMPEDYFFFLEETDWCWRIRHAGWRVVHVPDAFVIHIHGWSTKKRVPASTRIEYHRSLYLFFAKHRSAAALRVLLAWAWIRGIFYAASGAVLALFSTRARLAGPEERKEGA
jgi:GT2 family glycosyltransferase